jgi:hypothetical protein
VAFEAKDVAGFKARFLEALQAVMLHCPRTHSGRASVLSGRSVRTVRMVGQDGSVRTVGVSTDGHGRAAPAACPALTCAAESGVHLRVRAARVIFRGGSGQEGVRAVAAGVSARGRSARCLALTSGAAAGGLPRTHQVCTGQGLEAGHRPLCQSPALLQLSSERDADRRDGRVQRAGDAELVIGGDGIAQGGVDAVLAACDVALLGGCD